MDRIRYSLVEDIYDEYVQTTHDVPFFLKEAGKSGGEVLELMAGTGRVSIPLARAGIRLTCVDASPEMLERLRRKLREDNLQADVHEQDIRELDLGKTFDLVLIPFHSFAELLTREDREQTLRAVFRHTAPGGRFICTLHNPAFRLKTVDGRVKLGGTHNLKNDTERLVVLGLETYDPDLKQVAGLQFFERYDDRGVMQWRRLLEIRFAVVEKEELEDLAREAGFEVESLYGDYSHGAFDPERSPFLIWVLRKPA